jgi:hypothetical protein
VFSLATVGGIFVTWGLWNELRGEKESYATWSESNACHKMRKRGEYLVIVGVFVETVVAGIMAGKEFWESAQTAQQIALVDPLNLPIKSMKADIFLVIRATNELDVLLNDPKLEAPLRTMLQTLQKPLSAALILPKGFIFGKDSALGSLRCTAYERKSHFFGGGTEYSMSFSWPSGWMDDAAFTWFATNNVSAKALDEKMGSLEIMVMGLTTNSEIAEGSCVLTINGSIQKRFSVPKLTDRFSVRCFPVGTNSP